MSAGPSADVSGVLSGARAERSTTEAPTHIRLDLHIALAGPDVEPGFDRQHEDPPVTDFPGARRLGDRLNHLLRDVVRDDDLDLDLRQQADVVFLAAIDRGVPLLPAMTADFSNRHAGNIHLLERLSNVVHRV